MLTYTIVASNAGPSSAPGQSGDRHVPCRPDLLVDVRRQRECGDHATSLSVTRPIPTLGAFGVPLLMLLLLAFARRCFK
ncbi:MAG: hypothetical protein IPO58_21065 [Betaproteobacteria bacterium]|nr:hypothetical protein [Betaproteobacteria bacterium]